MKFFKDERVRKNLFVGCFLIIVFFLIYNIGHLYNGVAKLVNIFLPFILGSAIAFILNVPMRGIEKYLFRNRDKFPDEKWAGIRRALAIVLTLLVTFFLVALILYMVVPQLADTISQIVKQIPVGVMNISKWAEDNFGVNDIIQDLIEELANDWKAILEDVTGFLKKYLNSMLEGGINAITGIVSGVTNFIIGFIFAIYVLAQKEKLKFQFKKMTYALLKKETADRLVEIAMLTSKTFANFISGQCLEAFILGSMFFVVMQIMGLPYSMLISVLIGATALIPIVGAFIGCGIGFLLILLVNPIKAFVFLITFLIIQQIEGNIIYPRVVGSSVGLPGIWVLVSVTVGGSLFGVGGMIIFIPLVSVVYTLFRRYVYNRLNEKKLMGMFYDGYSSGGDTSTDANGDISEVTVDATAEEEIVRTRSGKPYRPKNKNRARGKKNKKNK